MLENFHGYFFEIGLPNPMIQKAEQLCEAFAQAIGGPLQGAFVSDFYEKEGARRFTSLWLRTPTYIIEAKDFVSTSKVDFTEPTEVEWVEFVRNDLVPFDHAQTTTTLAVNVRFSASIGGSLSAAHNNCQHLYNFALRNLMPRERSKF
jgi:hypothetical protein